MGRDSDFQTPDEASLHLAMDTRTCKLSTSTLHEGENIQGPNKAVTGHWHMEGIAGKTSAWSLLGCSPKQVPPASLEPDTELGGLWSLNHQPAAD